MTPRPRTRLEPLGEAEAEAAVARTCFTLGPAGRLGVELEFLVGDATSPYLDAHYPQADHPGLLKTLGQDGLDGRLTAEPGGQVELSSRPGPTLTETLEVVHRDVELLRQRAAGSAARLVGLGLDPVRPPRRVSSTPRYAAMARYLSQWGAAGAMMMCSTASVQVNVEAATVHQTVDDRWDLLQTIGPALVAAFVNSSRYRGRATGWKSTRQAVWHALDPARTGSPARIPSESVAVTYARWALDSPVMLVQRDNGDWSAPPGLRFRDWLRHGRVAVSDRAAPTIDDLNYHLTTLFPYVRARGHLEIRYIDALPGCWWTVPTAVVAAVLDDSDTSDLAREACTPVKNQWRRSARLGVEDPAIRDAAVRLLSLAADRLSQDQETRAIGAHIEAYRERWTIRGRSPCDDFPGPPSHDADGCPLDG